MSDHPNYRKIEADQSKRRGDYTWAERRAEIHDLLERAGHHRQLERTQRDLADRFDVSQGQIWKDIQAVLDWREARLGDDAEAELSLLKTRAVQERLEDDDATGAYDIAVRHYRLLMQMGEKEEAPDQHEVEHSGDVGWFDRIEQAAEDLETNGAGAYPADQDAGAGVGEDLPASGDGSS